MKFMRLSLAGLLILNTTTSLHGYTPKEQEEIFTKFGLCSLGLNKKDACSDYLAFLKNLESDQSGKRYESLEELTRIKAAYAALAKAIVKRNWINSDLSAEQVELLKSMIKNGEIQYSSTTEHNLKIFEKAMQKKLETKKAEEERAKKTKKQQAIDADLKNEIESLSRTQK